MGNIFNGKISTYSDSELCTVHTCGLLICGSKGTRETVGCEYVEEAK